MGESLQASVPSSEIRKNITENSNNLTNKHEYNFAFPNHTNYYNVVKVYDNLQEKHY